MKAHSFMHDDVGLEGPGGRRVWSKDDVPILDTARVFALSLEAS